MGAQAGLVRADQVALHEVPGRCWTGDDDALMVAGDHLGAFAVALDHGVGGIFDPNPFEGVAQVELARDVGADEVIQHRDLAGIGTGDPDTPQVARDHVARTDGVLGEKIATPSAGIAFDGLAVGRQADQVVLHDVARWT